jgi:excisionase family DNA binding protein
LGAGRLVTECRYVSIAECAEVLGVSERLIYELVARGELPAVELGRRKVIPGKALDLIEERALEGFDPDRLLTTLADTAGPSTVASPSSLAGASGHEGGPPGSAEVVSIAR